MNRRTFLRWSVMGGALLSLQSILNCQKSEKRINSAIARRKLGKTGEKLSIIGFGGIIVRDIDQKLADNTVARAIDRGVNYFDVAPSYGNAQEKLGPALKPYRKNSFLACKTLERNKSGAEKELNESLKKLHTDYFDLYQLHALTKKEDVETAFGPDGAMELFLKAKKEGKIRYLGFSAHSEDAALLAMQKFDFDTVLFPINFVCWYHGNFGPQVVAKAKEKQMGILALKAMALTRVPSGETQPYKKLWYIPIENEETANLALRFTLSLGTTAAIPPGDARFFWKALDIAEKYNPVTDDELNNLKKLASDVVPLFSNV